MPEGYEFPSCKSCNEATSQKDQAFGFLTHSVDFNPDHMAPLEMERMQALLQGMKNNSPDMVPSFDQASPVYLSRLLYTPPSGWVTPTPPALQEAAAAAARKLVHALFYKRSGGQILTAASAYTCVVYQAIDSRMREATLKWIAAMPEVVLATRSNRPKEAARFVYRMAFASDASSMMMLVQFGHGVMVFGAVVPCASLNESLTRRHRWFTCGPTPQPITACGGAA